MKSTLALLLLLVTPLLQALPPGVEYWSEPGHDGSFIHLMEVDPELIEIRPVKALEDGTFGLTPVSELVEAHGAVAGINGGFFEDHYLRYGSPAGILKISGEWLGFPGKARGAIGWSSDRSPQFERLRTHATVQMGDGFLPVERLNLPFNGSPTLYSPQNFEMSPPDGNCVQLFVRNQRIIQIRISEEQALVEADWMLAVNPKVWRHFTPEELLGRTTTLTVRFSPAQFLRQEEWEAFNEEWEDVEHIVGGTPLIVEEGVVVEDFSSEEVLESFLTRWHPRTAIGLLDNGHWLFVVVEGEAGWISDTGGMSMKQLARFMFQQGCVAALNLDGGSSSTMVVEGEVVNRLKRGEERPVGDALLLFSRHSPLEN